MKTNLFTLAAALFISLSSIAQTNNSKTMPCTFDVQLAANNEVIVRQLSDNNAPIKLQVYNSDGERIHSKKYKNTGTHLKIRYDISKIEDGDLTFKVVCSNNVVYAEQLTKYADGSISIPKEITLKQIDLEQSNETLISNK